MTFQHTLPPPPGAGGFPTSDVRNISQEFDPQNERETWAITGTLNWRINDQFSITNIINYREVDVKLVQDLDTSSVNSQRNHLFIINRDSFSEELQLHYDGTAFGKSLQAILGFYYFTEENFNKSDVGNTPVEGLFRAPINAPPSMDKWILQDGFGEADSWSVFFHGTIDILPKITLKVGGRFTHDERNIVNVNKFIVGPPPGREVTPGGTVAGSWNPFDPTIGLEWRPADNIMLYYTYSEGFKAGSGQLGSPTTTLTDPERIDNNEFGFKSQWFDRRLIVNIAGFFYDAEDIQFQRTLPSGTVGFTTLFENATGQIGHGIEVETSWSVTNRLEISSAVAWLEAEFQNFASVDPVDPRQFTDPAAALQSLDGNSPRQSPKWSASVHGIYDFPIANGGMLTVSADMAYKSKQYFTEFNNDLLSQAQYVLIDTRLRYTSPDERWTAELWGKNLTDKTIRGQITPSGLGRVIMQTFLPPRTWGVTVEVRF